MRRIHRAALAASLLLVPAGLSAQDAGSHHGFFLGAGLGHGSTQLTCSICQGGRDGGTSGYLSGGYSVTPRIRLGAEVLAWYKGGQQVDYLLTSAHLIAVLYPVPRNGFFIKTGFGLAKYAAEDSDNTVKTKAFAGQVGVGYEVPVGRGFSLVPFANFLGTTGGDVRFNNTVSNLSANTSLIQVGIGLGLN